MEHKLIVIAGILTLGLIVHRYYRSWQKSRALEHIPTHTFADGGESRSRYVSELKALLESGYRRYNKSGRAFKVPIPIGGYSVKYRVVLPKDHLEEMKHLSNNTFSWALASGVIFAQEYTGAPPRGPWSGKALRVGIHQNLDDVTKQLERRIDGYLDSNRFRFAQCGEPGPGLDQLHAVLRAGYRERHERRSCRRDPGRGPGMDPPDP